MIDLHSALSYLITSQRTVKKASQFGWNYVIFEMKFLANSEPLPDLLNPNNIDVFQATFIKMKKILKMVHSLLESKYDKSAEMAFWKENIHNVRCLSKAYGDIFNKLDVMDQLAREGLSLEFILSESPEALQDFLHHVKTTTDEGGVVRLALKRYLNNHNAISSV